MFSDCTERVTPWLSFMLQQNNSILYKIGIKKVSRQFDLHMIKTLTCWLLSRRQKSKHNRKETNYPVSLISFVKKSLPFFKGKFLFTFHTYPGQQVGNFGLQLRYLSSPFQKIPLCTFSKKKHTQWKKITSNRDVSKEGENPHID